VAFGFEKLEEFIAYIGRVHGLGVVAAYCKRLIIRDKEWPGIGGRQRVAMVGSKRMAQAKATPICAPEK
jgi:hypothetical protein